MATSEDIKKEILNYEPQVVDDEDFYSVPGLEVESEPEIDLSTEPEDGEQEAEEEPEVPISETPFEDPVSEWARQEKLKKAEKKEWNSMNLTQKMEFAKSRGYTPSPDSTPQITAEQEQAIIQNAYETDFLELADRYSPSLLAEFQKDFRLGKVKIPDNQYLIENAMEDLFLKWLGRSKPWSQMNHLQQKAIIKAAQDEPLRSRSADVVHANRVRPKPPKPEETKERKQKYAIPKFTPEQFARAVYEYVRNHPSEFKKGGKR